MNISCELQEVIVRIDQDSFISTLIKVTASFVVPVEENDIGGVEAVHKSVEVGERGFNQEVEVIFHQAIAVHFHIEVQRTFFQKFEKFMPIGISPEDR